MNIITATKRIVNSGIVAMIKGVVTATALAIPTENVEYTARAFGENKIFSMKYRHNIKQLLKNH